MMNLNFNALKSALGLGAGRTDEQTVLSRRVFLTGAAALVVSGLAVAVSGTPAKADHGRRRSSGWADNHYEGRDDDDHGRRRSRGGDGDGHGRRRSRDDHGRRRSRRMHDDHGRRRSRRHHGGYSDDCVFIGPVVVCD